MSNYQLPDAVLQKSPGRRRRHHHRAATTNTNHNHNNENDFGDFGINIHESNSDGVMVVMVPTTSSTYGRGMIAGIHGFENTSCARNRQD